MRNNRTAGNNWERTCRNILKEIFPKCETSRYASKMMDDQKVDLVNTGQFHIQCKNVSKRSKYDEILSVMPDDGHINIIFEKLTNKTNTRFIEKGRYAIMNLDDFITILHALDHNTTASATPIVRGSKDQSDSSSDRKVSDDQDIPSKSKRVR
jgi:hypothetical protein